ncbi:MAG: cupin-like domain-containing protein [Myxococcota bacterium]
MMLPCSPIPVDEVREISEAQFRRDYVDAHRPLIMRGAVAHWSAMGWDDATLLRVLAGVSLKVDVVPHSPTGSLDHLQAHQVKMGVAELIERFVAAEPGVHYYVHDLNLPLVLHADLGVHALSGIWPVERRKTLWWGSNGQTSQLHYDDNENLMCQFDGYKEFLLFDVTEFARMYPVADDFRSAIDLDASRPEDFPRFAEATPYLARIEAGDLLYVPCYWWHRVYSGGRNLAVSTIINETMEQRVRVAGRLVGAGALPIEEQERRELLEIVAGPERPAKRNAKLRAYHRAYVERNGRSYYPHQIFERIIEESLADILRGHAAY